MVKLTGGVARRAPIDLCYHNAIGLVDTDGSKAQGGMRCARGARAIVRSIASNSLVFTI